MRPAVPLLVVLTAAPGLLAAQATGAIRGRTLEGGLLPIGGVEVVVEPAARSVFSSATGTFLLDGLPAGEYQLTGRLPGYAAARLTVAVRAGVTVEIELHLERLPQQLDSIQVVAPQTPPVLIGSVHDTFGRPLENVEVLLQGVDRRTLTNAAGRFRLDSLQGRVYQLTARLPGFVAMQSRIPVRASGPTEVALRLRPFTQVLETIEVNADRRGLYGVVSTGALQPIVGASVRVYGGGVTASTDSGGRFAFPGLKGDDYLVGVTRAGFEDRRLHIEIPRNGRLEVAITMEPENPHRTRVPGERWISHDLGLQLSFLPSQSRVNRSELARHAGRQLCDIARIRRAARSTEAAIIVDGMRVYSPWSLCAFSADEVALVVLAGGCSVMGLPFKPPAGLRCIGVWTR